MIELTGATAGKIKLPAFHKINIFYNLISKKNVSFLQYTLLTYKINDKM